MSSQAESEPREPLRISLNIQLQQPQPVRTSSFPSSTVSPTDSFDPFSPPALSSSPGRSNDSALLAAHAHTPPPRTPSPSPPPRNSSPAPSPAAASPTVLDWSDLGGFVNANTSAASSISAAPATQPAAPSLPVQPPAMPKSLPLTSHNRLSSSTQPSASSAKPSPATTPTITQTKPAMAPSTFAPPPPPPHVVTSTSALLPSSASAMAVSPQSGKAVTPPQAALHSRSSSSAASSFSTISPVAASSSLSLSFADSLSHKPAVITAEIHSTLATVRSLSTYYHKLATAYKDTATAIHRLSSTEYGRVSGSASSGGSTVVSAVMGLFDRMNGVGQLYGNLEADVRERCVEPLKRCYENGNNMVRESEMEFKKSLTAVEQANAGLLKEKENARQALAAHSREKEKVEESATTSTGDATVSSLLAQANNNAVQLSSSLFSAFKQVQRHLTTSSTATADPSPSPAVLRHPSVDAARKKAIRCCETYQRSVDALNTARQRSTKEVLPRVLKDMQAQQELTLTTITATVATFVELTDAFAHRLTATAGELRNMLGAVSVDSDVRQFIVSSVDQHGQATAAEVAKYELSVTAKDLMREDSDLSHGSPVLSKADSGSGSTGLFKTTLDGCMRHDRSTQPLTSAPFSAIPANLRLDVPLIVPYLILLLIHHDGLDAEGIFRLSASADEVANVRHRLDNHDYHALESIDSPHTAAALLKSFLRDLADPLVPASLYDRCIELGRSHMLNDRPLAVRRSELTDLMAAVPTLNRRVLFHLLALLGVIGHTAVHSERSRMTPQNLSIVFAPSVLRAAHSDAVLLLAESKFACQFVYMLLDGWEEERDGMWKEEWEWSERPEAGCQGYEWWTGDRTAAAAAAVNHSNEVQEERKAEAEENGAGSAPVSSAAAAAGSLPAGWQSSVDSSTGLTYYFHTQSNEVTWVKPAG